MAVISTDIVGSRINLDSKANRLYTVRYRIITDTRLQDPGLLYFSAGIPQLYSSYGTNDPLAQCRSIDIDYENESLSNKIFIATCVFSSEPTNRQDEDDQDDPLVERPELTFDFSKTSVPLTIDKDGNAVSASNGEPFEGLTKDETLMGISITQNIAFASFDLEQLRDYRDAINTQEFFGLDQWTVKIGAMRAAPKWTSTGPFVKRSITFEITPDEDWRYRPRDRGSFYLDAGDPKEFRIEGMPQPFGDLDGNGGALTIGADPIFFDGAGPKDPIKAYKERDFGTLGVPTSLTEWRNWT